MAIAALEVVQELKERLSHVEDEIGQIRSGIIQMEALEWGDAPLLIEEAEKVAQVRKPWSREMIAEEGNRLMEECRSYAVSKGIALEDEREAAIGD